MTLKKYVLHGENYVFYASTLFQLDGEADTPTPEQQYYIHVRDMSKTDGIVSDEMVVTFEQAEELAEDARYVLPPNEDYYCGIVDLNALKSLYKVTAVEETQDFQMPTQQWSWQSRVNRMCRDPSDVLTPPLMVGVDGDDGHEKLEEWANSTAAEITDTVGRNTAIVICPETAVRDLCELDFVTSVEVDGVAHEA